MTMAAFRALLNDIECGTWDRFKSALSQVHDMDNATYAQWCEYIDTVQQGREG